jgi:hypothetical protein
MIKIITYGFLIVFIFILRIGDFVHLQPLLLGGGEMALSQETSRCEAFGAKPSTSDLSPNDWMISNDYTTVHLSFVVRGLFPKEFSEEHHKESYKDSKHKEN